MTNEEILEKRWNSIDKYLKKYVNEYNKLNTKMKDKLQDVFNSFDIEYSDINKPISKAKKDRLYRFINKLKDKGLLTGYFGYQARLLLNRKNVTYAEMLEIMIQGSYLEENKELDEINNDLFYKVCETSYNQGLEEINGKTSNLFNSSKFALLLSIPILGMTISQYMESLALTNANELYKQTLVNKQLGKDLNVDNRSYSVLFKKQRNRIVDINGDKLSGGIVNITNNLSNSAFLEAGKDNNIKQCRFIAELDKRTTDMCKSMDNMLFNIDDWNKFYRYSAVDGRDVLYTVKGLEVGINLPPITNHFHWCRSTITYLIDMPRSGINKKIQTFDEKLAINKWLSSDFYSINQKMYSDLKLTKEEKKLVKDLYTGLNKEPYYKPKDNEYIVRMLEVDSDTIKNIISTHELNKVYKSKAFESYSLKDDYNPNANVFFYVKGSKKARNMLEYNPMEKEAEVLYQYGTEFVTKDYYNKNGKHYFLLEEYDD